MGISHRMQGIGGGAHWVGLKLLSQHHLLKFLDDHLEREGWGGSRRNNAPPTFIHKFNAPQYKWLMCQKTINMLLFKMAVCSMLWSFLEDRSVHFFKLLCHLPHFQVKKRYTYQVFTVMAVSIIFILLKNASIYGIKISWRYMNTQ